ncbi:MAG: DoxX family protein [Chloroherpetonaceae bacterium]|nr:DoxX family protein [Chloroherpetonaceae bacterium]
MSKLKSLFFSPNDTRFHEESQLILRLLVGLFMAYHGYGKFTSDLSGFAGYLGKIGFPLPELFARLATYAELFGGIFIALGFLFRAATVFLAITMFVAAFIAHGHELLSKGELALVYFVVSVVLFLQGAGKYSLDALIFKQR